MRSSVKLVLSGLLMTAVALFLLFSPGDVSFAGSNNARVIMFDPVENCQPCAPLRDRVPPNATITLHTFSQGAGSGEAHVSVTGLRQPRMGVAHALYFAPQAGLEPYHPQYHVFNVDFTGDATFWTEFPLPIELPTITAFIAEEHDDGRSFATAQGDMQRLALVGTSTR